MAKGRFISKEICLDKRVNELSCADSMLGFTWLITHADCEGRTYGDPAIVKSLIFPRRTDITIEMVSEFIKDWENAGLIVTYEADGDLYIEFPNFGKHQVGLRKDREPESGIPANIRQTSGKHPANIRQTSGKHPAEVKLIEVKLSEGEEPNFFSKFQAVVGLLLAGDKDTQYLKTLIQDYGEEKILKTAEWLRKKDPNLKSMRVALKSIDTAAANWGETKKQMGEFGTEFTADQIVGGKV